MADQETTIRITRRQRVTHIRMARPDQHNAFNPAMIAALTEAFSEAGREARTRVVVLSGDGRSFSAGADLNYMRSMADFGHQENVADAKRLAGLFSAVRDCPKPVVARVHGAAMGGGVGLVAACDIAVAAEGTRFAFSEARLGIVPAVISPFVVPRIGASAARELFLTGERFDARRALEIGLVAHVVPADDLDGAVTERVEALLAAGPEAQATIKALLPRVLAADDTLTELTAETIARCRASDEGREGMAAFFERREPSWVETTGSDDRPAGRDERHEPS